MSLEGGGEPWCECRDGAQVLLGPKAWDLMKSAANIALMDDMWFRETAELKHSGLLP